MRARGLRDDDFSFRQSVWSNRRAHRGRRGAPRRASRSPVSSASALALVSISARACGLGARTATSFVARTGSRTPALSRTAADFKRWLPTSGRAAVTSIASRERFELSKQPMRQPLVQCPKAPGLASGWFTCGCGQGAGWSWCGGFGVRSAGGRPGTSAKRTVLVRGRAGAAMLACRRKQPAVYGRPRAPIRPAGQCRGFGGCLGVLHGRIRFAAFVLTNFVVSSASTARESPESTVCGHAFASYVRIRYWRPRAVIGAAFAYWRRLPVTRKRAW